VGPLLTRRAHGASFTTGICHHMKRPLQIVLGAFGAILCFSAGAWYAASGRGPSTTAAGGRRILYYHDPMHPAYRSDKPGTAPDCGMDLEPVYAGDPAESAGRAFTGTLQVSARRQQAIGIRSEQAREFSGEHTVRVLGRVAADETRIYKLNASVPGWIRDIAPDVTTGSFVRKGQTLASFYAPEFLAAEQAYLYAVAALDRFQATGRETDSQIDLTRANIQQARDSLALLGMSDLQADEIAKSRQLSQRIRIVAPADGFVVARNVSPGQRFDNGAEFFRIADLSRVWVLADLFENEDRLARSAVRAVVRYQGRPYPAHISTVPPLFDTATRTLTLRLEVPNTDLRLRPDMFVDVETMEAFPPGITVPSDAVLDSGRRKTVFIDQGDGSFEARDVETAARVGDRVVVLHGVAAGERVVVGGNFLLDSESRLQAAAARSAPAAPSATAAKDPVCGMDVDASKADGRKAPYAGTTYSFCSESCKRKFDANPAAYTAEKNTSVVRPGSKSQYDRQNH